MMHSVCTISALVISLWLHVVFGQPSYHTSLSRSTSTRVSVITVFKEIAQTSSQSSQQEKQTNEREITYWSRTRKRGQENEKIRISFPFTESLNRIDSWWSATKVCPDRTIVCRDTDTCCPLAGETGNYGCCPWPKAVCCEDGIHCCPHNTACDVPKSRCIGEVDSVNLLALLSTIKGDADLQEETPPPAKKRPATRRTFQHVCPDRDSECSRNQTCCQSSFGDFRCCPFPGATCCSDGKHCCPHGMACNLEEGTCDNNSVSGFDSAAPLRPILPRQNPKIVICPDPNYECSQGETCCKLVTGDWGCCRFENATCCSDEIHCCPANTICDLQRETCKPKQAALLSQRETAAAMKAIPVYNIGNVTGCHGDNQLLCPDSQTCCLQGDTCCSQSKYDWMTCCNFSNGVCCNDGQNCCPFSYSCHKNPDGSMGCNPPQKMTSGDEDS